MGMYEAFVTSTTIMVVLLCGTFRIEVLSSMQALLRHAGEIEIFSSTYANSQHAHSICSQQVLFSSTTLDQLLFPYRQCFMALADV